VMRREDREPLGTLEGAGVGAHPSAAANADVSRGGRDRTDQRLGARAREHRTAVVLGYPVAVIAELVGEPSEVERVRERVNARRALGDRRLIEHRDEHAHVILGTSRSVPSGPMSIGTAALRSVAATRYVTPFREGGSLPGLMEADDDGLYVTK